jgi:hypothetical protein
MPRHYNLASVKEITSEEGERRPDDDEPSRAPDEQRKLVAASLLLCPDRDGQGKARRS